MNTTLLVRIAAAVALISSTAFAAPKGAAGCEGLPDHAALKAALQNVVKEGEANTGLGFNMWASIVNRDGVVCAVAFSGADRGAQWPGSRLISAEKASAANAFSLPGFALSTANLYFPTQPGQSLWGLATSAPPNPAAMYIGPGTAFGQPNDPMVGKMPGGLITFGGGFGLYDQTGKIIGGLGVSGDTSCADHVIGWKLRHALKLNFVPAGVANGTDNLILDVKNGVSTSGFGHPSCGAGKSSDEAIKSLPEKYPVAKKVAAR